MKKIAIITLTLLLLWSSSLTAVELDSVGRDTKYVNTIIERSKKVTDELNMTNTPAGKEILKIIANRYFKLNDIYAVRDSMKKQAAALQGKERQKITEAAENEKDMKLYRSHFGFITDLSIYLNDDQIEMVKDVLTYHVVKVTYDAQCDMIPTLKAEEKTQILAWLKEGREYAMDAESSNKKHEAFGKYKGRINNYLTKRGYDLKKEREAWEKRVKARGGKL
jgi:hypothetical protein